MDIRKIFIVIIGLFLFLGGCKTTVTNSVTFKSIAIGNMYVNFMGETFTLVPNGSKTVRNIPQGTYNYSTAYDIPDGVTSASTSGAVNGPVEMNADTRITVLYSSSLQGTGATLNYIVSATISSNDKVITPTGGL
ncbi:MAG: hypothetical protein COZ80_08570 [Ignavibacteria bacterium CG_4_8_14_3_um_filter_37_9]|nr:hypothetical protein [Ignavibacteria bacterium]OIO15808.1 MAG: hypothetical protein AUJ54_12205 [Ignavibacteria bacterium CG1_02_37_35]PIP76111.1 MAG: hypothetical protein COW85_15915 [Ignavibacteria bacterium CG22_combo_CG10-13_8_21_14_all_37_15]PIS44846.1 MAG: hypothetical protein COT22_08430 [Ignavibacteria bacterium CG08_land_8_20_14_0_20_37_9]PIW98839.1 MAG: hypothetical protein COZ80_08570 [Ignavibacteria bacterium CG_4_8_14_3_um_filter_37_9]PIX93955.1 MAG: hypothetical protein COZ25_